MNRKLKCVIFGDRDVIRGGKWFSEVQKLIEFLISKNIQPVILSNDLNSSRLNLEKQLKAKYPQLEWYIGDRDGNPKKPTAQSVKFVLDRFGFEDNEAVFIGNSINDMRTAVNAGLLYLNAVWYGRNNDYGFEFQEPKEIARFVDIFCLRDYLWAYEINQNELEYYALGIYGTREQKYDYSKDAKEAAKFGRGEPNFWIKYLLSTVYFSGLHKRIDYIAPYPSHNEGTACSVMEDHIITFAKCFRAKYLKDLIIRHTKAQKSAFARYSGQPIDHLNQLNTIKLNPQPIKNLQKMIAYVHSPLKSGRTILIIDDFCTEGYSLEAARLYIEQTGANIVLISLLKTIVRDYQQITEIQKIEPYEVNTGLQYKIRRYPFNQYLTQRDAWVEIRSKLQEYKQWQW